MAVTDSPEKMAMDCKNEHLIRLLMSYFSSNDSAWSSRLCTNGSTASPTPTLYLDSAIYPPDGGKNFYAFVTPVIIIVGLIGNLISLRVFLSPTVCKLSASLYLAALSVSDSLVLVSYVWLDWLNNGLPRWPPAHRRLAWINAPGVCRTFLYAAYTFRFVSVWLVVAFTVERYIAVCRPLQRRAICTRTIARRAIVAVAASATLISLYKPLISGLYNVPTTSPVNLRVVGRYNSDAGVDLVAPAKVCTRDPHLGGIAFFLELVYGLAITAVPLVVITVFNCLITHKLVTRDKVSGHVTLVQQESRLRLEFTLALLAVSTCFVCLNIPYFVVWCEQFVQSVHPQTVENAMRISNRLYVTRTIFNINYGINFFLYCLTGSYYRSAISRVFQRRGSTNAAKLLMLRKHSTSTSLVSQNKELSYM